MGQMITIHDDNSHLFSDEQAEHGGVRRVFGAKMVPGRFRATPTTLGDVGIGLFPESEWPDRIAEKAKAGSWLKDLTYGLPALNQRSVGQCWLFGNCGAMRALSVKSGGVLRLPSVQCLAYSLRGSYRRWGNGGGDPADSAQALVDVGACRDELWPSDPSVGQSAKYWTNAAQDDRLNLRCDRMVELGRDEDIWLELGTCLLKGVPVGVCFDWWGHHVWAAWLEFVSREVQLGIDNSWGPEWSDNGYGLLAGKRKRPDGAWAFVEMVQAS